MNTALAVIPENESDGLPDHARYSPSGMARGLQCWVSIFLEQHLENVKTTHSSEGDVAHELGAYFARQHLTGTPLENLTVVGRPEKANPINDEMIRHCKAYVQYISAVIAPYLHLPHQWYIEKKLILLKEPSLFGTSDFVFLYQTPDGFWHAIVIDLKYGQGVKVSTDENWQLIAYGLFAIAQFENNSKDLEQMHLRTRSPRAEAAIMDVDTHIFQPRAREIMPPMKFSREDLTGKYWSQIQELVQFSEALFAKYGHLKGADFEALITSPEFKAEYLDKYQRKGSDCKFCKVKRHGKCRLYADSIGTGNVLELLGMVKPHVEAAIPNLPQELTPTGKIKKPPTVAKVFEEKPKILQEIIASSGILSPEDRAFLALHKTEIIAFIEAVAYGLKSELKTGTKNEFVMLSEASPIRALIDDKQKVNAVLQEKFGIMDFFTNIQKELSMTEIEKRIGKGALDELGLTKVVSETTKLMSTKSGATPAPPRGFNIQKLLGMEFESDPDPEDEPLE